MSCTSMLFNFANFNAYWWLGSDFHCTLYWTLLEEIPILAPKSKKANNILGAIRSFSYLDNTIMLRLFTSLVRPHLEYANPVWSPRYKKDIYTIENVQKRATKMIPAIRDLPYKERLKILKLPSMAYRRLLQNYARKIWPTSLCSLMQTRQH